MPYLTAEQLIEVLSADLTVGNRGRLEARRRATSDMWEKWLLKNLLEEDVRPPAPAVPRPPFWGVGPKGPAERPLDAADLAWIGRLPSDTKDLPVGDARELASLAMTVPVGSSDARLVESVLRPAQLRLEREHAEAQLRWVKASEPRLPAQEPRRHGELPGRVEIVASALQRQKPDMPDEAALVWAEKAVSDARADTVRKWEMAVADAEAHLAAVEAGEVRPIRTASAARPAPTLLGAARR